jgi:hypothetical protein
MRIRLLAGKVMRLLVTGTREPTDAQVRQLCADLAQAKADHGAGDNLVVIQGECRGIDRLAATWCGENNVHCAGVPALWRFRPRAAGVQRNDVMVKLLEPQEALAYPSKDGSGTQDCIKRLRRVGVPVTVREP